MNNQLFPKEYLLKTFDIALADSKRIAQEIEDHARQRSETLLQETVRIVLETQTIIELIDSGIAWLGNEIENYLKLQNQVEDKNHHNKDKFQSDSSQDKKDSIIGSVYTIKLISFLNAKHFVSFNGKAGPVHAHSWQVQISAGVNLDHQELVGFTKVIDPVKAVFEPYENKILNEIYPFNIIQPTTENISFYLYNCLDDTLASLGLHLITLSVWETPTKGIEITARYKEFDQLVKVPEKCIESNLPLNEAAAAVEDGTELPGDVIQEDQVTDINSSVETEEKKRKYLLVKWILALVLLIIGTAGTLYSSLFVHHQLYSTPTSIGKSHKFLVIGKYGEMVKAMFSEVEQGESSYLDDYSLEYLKNYSSVLLAGVDWRVKTKAEKTLKGYAVSGGRVFIELSGMKDHVLSGTPRFLGVDGELVSLEGKLEIFGQGKKLTIPLWSNTNNSPALKDMEKVAAYVPMGLDKKELEFIYYGNTAPVFGYKLVDGNRINFLGGNLFYHAFLTGDQVTLDFLGEILGLKPRYNIRPKSST